MPKLSAEQSEKARIRAQTWRDANPDRKKAQSRNWHLNNKPQKREYDLKWAADNPERAKLNKFKTALKKYGITYEDYMILLRHQKGRCAMCRRYPDKDRRLCVDHDHFNGRVRGLLCDGCNKKLGILESIFEEAECYFDECEGGHPLLYKDMRVWHSENGWLSMPRRNGARHG